jgi:hypothetical protein
MKRAIFVAIVIVAAACGPSSPRTQPEWRAANDHPQPLDQAKAACKSYALKQTEGITSAIVAKAAAGAFAECMYEQGWSLRDADASAR